MPRRRWQIENSDEDKEQSEADKPVNVEMAWTGRNPARQQLCSQVRQETKPSRDQEPGDPSAHDRVIRKHKGVAAERPC